MHALSHNSSRSFKNDAYALRHAYVTMDMQRSLGTFAWVHVVRVGADTARLQRLFGRVSRLFVDAMRMLSCALGYTPCVYLSGAQESMRAYLLLCHKSTCTQTHTNAIDRSAPGQQCPLTLHSLHSSRAPSLHSLNSRATLTRTLLNFNCCWPLRWPHAHHLVSLFAMYTRSLLKYILVLFRNIY